MSQDTIDSPNKEKFDSITHFLETGGFTYCVYDMGRKVKAIDNDLFKKIEGQKVLYPTPIKKKASIALLFWQEGKQDQAVIWFLEFPVDELGFLKLEARDAFLIDLLEQTGKNIQAKQQGEEALDELKESPFAFKPAPDKLAIFHALATKILDQEPSPYYQHALEYLKGSTGFDQWQFLGIQGIADVVVRLDKSSNIALLIGAIDQMPEAPLVGFCSALENVKPSVELAQVLMNRLDKALSANESNQLVAILVRALSGAIQSDAKRKAFLKVLGSDIGSDIEVMVAFSAKAWGDLAEKTLLKAYVLNLDAINEMAFNAIVSDLMMLPNMRSLLLNEFRSSAQPKSIKDKFERFITSFDSSLFTQ